MGQNSSCQDADAPWVFWYWNDAAVSKAGITADLEAMKQQGLGGAYLFFIRGAAEPPVFSPPAVQLSDHWWDLVRFAFAEAKRLGLQIGLHACDGFTTAGGPWISPAASMKKLVWADTLAQGSTIWQGVLPQPEMLEGFYEDIKTFAYRVEPSHLLTHYALTPTITTSIPDVDASWLNDPTVKNQRLRSAEPCWLQYAFEEPFTCRSITLKGGGNNFQANRLILEVSDDGKHYRMHTRLQPHRQGWMDGQFESTHAIAPVEARYFRFRYDPAGTEPGAEDLDAAKWRPSFKVSGLELSSEAKIHQFEGKNASVWRVAAHTTNTQLTPDQWVSQADVVDLSDQVDQEGNLKWNVPAGTWRIRRIGYTSTGKTNYIGGGAKGLESDKFDAAVARQQFEEWIGAFYREIPVENLQETLTAFHIDSWECGSQNWSKAFAQEFTHRRGYALLPNLLVMTGVPLQSPQFSEQVLLDVRETIAELIRDNFFNTFKQLAAERNLCFSAESTAPVMVGDGMLHHRIVDLPMGEFWYNSPTHDKPNDILDAISGAHIYGKPIVQAESFTEIRLDWDEHPAKLKQVLDQNFALGINRIVPHVFNHNPWLNDRKPGMTLGIVGTFYQPTQTWFDSGGKAFIAYIKNCQQWLQRGVPVVDVAVFTGEEIPRRAILPDRLVQMLPGIFGDTILAQENARLLNADTPMKERPRGVFSQANMANPADWLDPLNGYAYDSFNKDALLRLSRVEDGKIVLPGGAAYAMLVVPGSRRMMPEGNKMSLAVARKLLELIKAGGTVYLQQHPSELIGFANADDTAEFQAVIDTLFAQSKGDSLSLSKLGKGQIITGAFKLPSFAALGIQQDIQVKNAEGMRVPGIAWNHRKDGSQDIYFIANQTNTARQLELSFRVSNKTPRLYFPNQNRTLACTQWTTAGGYIELPLRLEAKESCFVLLDDADHDVVTLTHNWPEFAICKLLENPWQVQFDTAFGGLTEVVTFDKLTDWIAHPNDNIKYYSGTATYRQYFRWMPERKKDTNYVLSLGQVHNLARVKLNGQDCGVAWTAPYQVDISAHLREGENLLEVEVTNTWANRLMGDQLLEEHERVSWTTANYRLEGRPLLPAGLLGPVQIMEER